MRTKNKYLYLEAVLTFFLLLSAVFAFRNVFKDKAYLVSGFLFSFSFGWFIRNKNVRLLKSFVTVGALAGSTWAVYAILNSSFFHEDIILICLKGVLVLEFILSFGAWSQPFLSYIQALSVILFVSHPIFLRKPYDLVSLAFTAAYVIIWFFVLRFKFYGFLKEPAKRNRLIYFSLSAFLISILIFSSVLFFNFPFGRSKWSGVFYNETLGGEGRSGEKKEESSQKYYDLQDKVQEGVLTLMPSLDSFDARQETIFLLSSLTKEPSRAIEVEKAETGLMTRLKTPGPGLEEKEMQQLSASIKSYVDKKIELNLESSQRETSKFLGQQPFNIKDRFSILSSVNKMRRAGTFQKLKEQQKELRKNINDSSLRIEAKTQLNSLAGKIEEWKIFEIYRKALGDLEKHLEPSDDYGKKEFDYFISEVKQLKDSSALKQADNRLRNLKQMMPSDSRGHIKNSEDILGLKLEMLLEAENAKLEEKAEELDLPESETKKLKEDSENLRQAEDYEGFSKEAEALEERIERENIDISAETADLLIAKTYSLKREKKQEIENILDETVLSEAQKEAFLERIQNMDSTGTLKSLDSDASQLKTDIEQFIKQGSISKEAKNSLTKAADEFKNILLSQAKLEIGRLAKGQASDVTAEALEKMINEASLREENKEALRRLTNELFKSDSLSEFRNIQQEVEKETTGVTLIEDSANGDTTMSTGSASAGDGIEGEGEIKPAGQEEAAGASTIAQGKEGMAGVSLMNGGQQSKAGAAGEDKSGGAKSNKDSNIKTSTKGGGKGEGKGEEEKEEEKEEAGSLEKKAAEEEPMKEKAGRMETGRKEVKKRESQKEEATKKDRDAIKDVFNPAIESRKTAVMNSDLLELRKAIEGLRMFDSQGASALDNLLAAITLDSTEEEFENALRNLHGEASLIETKIQREKLQKKESAYWLNLVKNFKSGLEKTKNKLALRRKNKLISIRINPGNLNIHFGEKGQFHASGIYSDNKEKDLTSFIEWISLNKEVAGVFQGTVYTRRPGEAKVYARLRKIESAPVSVIVKEPRLVSIILSPEERVISMKEKLEIRAEGYLSDGSRKDITSLVGWNISAPRVIRLKAAFVEPLSIGETQIYAKYSDVTSLPARIRVIFTAGWLMGIIIEWGTYFMFAVLAMFSISYFITRHKASRLLLLYKDPRNLTIKLYENAKKIIRIFGLKGEGEFSPRSYAKLVEKKHAIENNLFFNFTVKFEEANYSRHVLQPESSALILNDYNSFLKLLLGRCNSFNLFLRYCQALLHRSPLFIKAP